MGRASSNADESNSKIMQDKYLNLDIVFIIQEYATSQSVSQQLEISPIIYTFLAVTTRYVP